MFVFNKSMIFALVILFVFQKSRLCSGGGKAGRWIQKMEENGAAIVDAGATSSL